MFPVTIRTIGCVFVVSGQGLPVQTFRVDGCHFVVAYRTVYLLERGFVRKILHIGIHVAGDTFQVFMDCTGQHAFFDKHRFLNTACFSDQGAIRMTHHAVFIGIFRRKGIHSGSISGKNDKNKNGSKQNQTKCRDAHECLFQFHCFSLCVNIETGYHKSLNHFRTSQIREVFHF